MKSKYLVIVTMMLLSACSNEKVAPERIYLNNAMELSHTILSFREMTCDCILLPDNGNKSLFEIIQSENPVLEKETLKKALGIQTDTAFNTADELSKSFRLPDSIYRNYKTIKTDDLRLARRDSLVAKNLFKKCPDFWIHVGPVLFNEDYTKAVIPVSAGVGGSLDVYHKIDHKWKFIKSIVSWIS